MCFLWDVSYDLDNETSSLFGCALSIRGHPSDLAATLATGNTLLGVVAFVPNRWMQQRSVVTGE